MIDNSQHDNVVQLDSGEPELDLRKYLSVLLKHKWSIIGIALMAALIGLYLALRAVPVYEGSARLQIQRDTSAAAFSDGYSRLAFSAEFYKTQYELIRSWGVAEMAAKRLGMLDQPPPADEQGFQWRDWLPEFLAQPDRVLSADEIRAQRIKYLQQSVRVAPVEGSQLARISIQHTSPTAAAARVNAIAESYIDFLKDKSLENLETDQNWYASRLEQAKQEMDDANRVLQQFYERQGLLQTAEGADAIQYQALQTAVQGQTGAQTERQGLERLYRDISNARAGQGSLETISALETRGVVRNLKSAAVDARRATSELAQRYGPRHPRMIEANTALANAESEYQAELERAADSVLADYRRALEAERTYTAQVDAAKDEIRVIDRNRAERQKLEDAADSAKALFEKIQTGERTAGMLGTGTQKPYVTVIERARPVYRPVRPNKQRMVLLAAMLGLMLGIGLAFLLEHLDNTFRGAPEVEDRLGMPLLGTLQDLGKDKANILAPMSRFKDAGKSPFAEAVRTIRTGIMLSAMDSDSTVIMVTSSVPGEGKTTLSTNLSHALGHMKNTLLLDADMRRPMVGKAHDRDREHPGLSAYMTHEASFEECTLRSDSSQLSIMHAGSVPPNPLELLGSNRFQQVIDDFRRKFDYIVIDCAPALAVSDALVLSRMVDHVIYVIKADSTPYQAAQEGVHRLRRVNAPMLGVVLNRVTSRGRGYYYYGKYHRYGYRGYGYHDYQYPEYYGSDTKGS